MNDLRNYKALSKEDMKNDKWKFAPILVSTNRERVDINEKQARNFAREKKTYVIRWQAEYKNWRGKPNPEDRVINEDPVFWQYFVSGAEGYITANVNTDISIANGTSCNYHSLSFASKDESDWLEHEMMEADFGSIISLKSPPASVNVVLFQDDKDKKDNWDRDTLVQGKVVIPIFQSKSFCKWSNFLVQGGIQYGYNPSYIDARSLFPIDLGFSMTLHKAQGRTLKAVILALSERPIHQCQVDFCGFFVAMSRVKQSEDIRFLLKNPRDYTDSLLYLTHLKQPESIQQYFNGFCYIGSSWDADLAYDSMIKEKKQNNK